MQFQVGDQVLITNLNENVNDNPGVVPRMFDYIGQVFTIRRIDNTRIYFEEVYTFCFHPDWLMAIENKEKEGKEKINKEAIEKSIAECRKVLRKYAGKNSTAVCGFAYSYMKEGEKQINVEDCSRSICHAPLKTYSNKTTIYGLVDWIGNYKVKVKEQNLLIYKQYIKWILNKSPVASTFLTKRLSTAFSDGVLYDVSKGSNQIALAAVMMRMGTEYQCNLPIMQLARDEGFSWEISFLLFCLFKQYKDSVYQSNRIAGHHILRYDMKVGQVIQFLSNKFQFSKQKPYSESNNGYHIETEIDKLKVEGKESLLNFVKRISNVENAEFGEITKYSKEQVIEVGEVLQSMLDKENE